MNKAKTNKRLRDEESTDQRLSTSLDKLDEERRQLLREFQEKFAKQQIHILRQASTLTWADVFDLLVEYEQQAPWTLRRPSRTVRPR